MITNVVIKMCFFWDLFFLNFTNHVLAGHERLILYLQNSLDPKLDCSDTAPSFNRPMSFSSASIYTNLIHIYTSPVILRKNPL